MIRFEFDSRSENEAMARVVIAAYLLREDPTLEEMADIKTAVSEAVTNAIIHGYEDTIAVTVDDMIHHGRAVAKGAKNALVVVDMPFMSYQTSVYDAVVNAGRIMKETHCGAVKLEGGAVVCPQIKAIVDASIPVCAHLGLTPQSINAFGGLSKSRERCRHGQCQCRPFPS